MVEPRRLGASVREQRVAHLEKATVTVLFAFDVGRSVDLEQARRRVTDRIEPSRLEHRRRAPTYFQFEPPPLRILKHGEAREVAGRRTAPDGEIVLYDFGAMCVRYDVPFQGTLEELASFSAALGRTEALGEAARRRAEEVLGVVGDAVQDPTLSALVEDYLLFRVEEMEAGCPLEDFLARHGAAVARLLASTEDAPSREEVDDLLQHRASYGPDDLTVVDWSGALVVGRDMDDVVDVLEFANVQVLEMRFLDDRLDQALDRAYASLLPGAKGGFRLPGSLGTELPRVARMQVDGAVLFERVSGALQLLGDQWLARVYRIAAQRFHLPEWNAILLRKLDTLDSIYQKLFDQASTRRMEALEWLIIVLIALGLVIPFVI